MLDGKKVIFYELNEVPFRILDWFISARPRSGLAQLVRHGRSYRTYTEDEGHLTPWVTWPSLHRGVTNQEHEIHDFGQDLTRVDAEYPPLWQMLAHAGRTVGVFGSLHSYPLPDKLDNYAFYVPDTFAAGPECFPKKFSSFQQFNLEMVDRSGRNVTRSIAFNSALRFIRAAPRLGLRARTAFDVGHQLLSEQFKKERIVRRRTTQCEIAFDFFLAELEKTRPDAAFFFTNHVASSMHRYWPALFPHDYQISKWPDAWRETYRQEIPHAMAQADRQVSNLMDFVKRDGGYVLLVASSMGQAAVEGSKIIKNELNLNDPNKFMRRLGLAADEWSRRRAMVPRYVFVVSESAVDRFRDAVGDLTVNGQSIRFLEHERGVFMVHIGLKNLDDRTIDVRLRGEAVRPEELGLVNRRIQDEAGSNAFHVPEGSMIVFDPRGPSDNGTARPTLSTREVAPSLLRNFGVDVPGYMQRPSTL
jgi:hypothetical protein